MLTNLLYTIKHKSALAVYTLSVQKESDELLTKVTNFYDQRNILLTKLFTDEISSPTNLRV